MNWLLKINNSIYFWLLCIICGLFIFAAKYFLYTDELYYSTFGEQFTADQIQKIISFQNVYWRQAIGYCIIPLIIIVRVLYTSLCLFIGNLVNESGWKFRSVYTISLKADIAFCLSQIGNFYYYAFSDNFSTVEDLSINFASLLKIVGKDSIPNWLVLAYNSINLFELIYITLLIIFLKITFRLSYLKSIVIYYVDLLHRKLSIHYRHDFPVSISLLNMKKKTVIVFIFVLLLLGLSSLLLFDTIQRTQQKKEVYQSIPSFQISDINGFIITEALLQEYRTVMFIYFNPDCDLCRDEMIQIKENESALSQGKIVFFSLLPADSIRQFLQTIEFEPTQNMLFLLDEKATLVSEMEVRATPTVYIYRKGQLIKRFDGPVKIETLINYFAEE